MVNVIMNNLNAALKEKLKRAEILRKEKKFTDSSQLCDEIIRECPTYDYTYTVKCNNLFDLGKVNDAFEELKQFIDITSKPAGAYFIRAQWNLILGNDSDVIDDTNLIIKMNDSFHLEAARFFKSVALLNLNKKIEAMELCLGLPDDFKFPITTKLWGFRVLKKCDLQSAINLL